MNKHISGFACFLITIVHSIGSVIDVVPDDATKEALDELPRIGSSAEIAKTEMGLLAVAVGFGVCAKDGDNEKLDLSTRKAKALRAAVISAKSALGEKMSGQISSVVRAVISDGSSSLQSESVLNFSRTVVTCCSLWKSEVKVEEGDGKCIARAWIFFPSMELLDQASGGIPRFDDRHAASEFLALAASKGLCDVGAMRLLIGKKGEEKPIRFVVARSSSQVAQVVTAMKAQAELLRQSGGGTQTIEGSRKLIRKSRVLDSLSTEGNEEAMNEVPQKFGIDSLSGAIRISAERFEKTVGDMRYYVVSEASD